VRRSPRSGVAPLLGVGLLFGASGCTFSEGEPYGLVSASMQARYELRDDRDVGDDGWQKLSNELQLRLDEARLAVERVDLIDAGGGATASSATGAVFDPANPPPGYTLCHNGHCHSDSGDLVPYEDIQAELAAGGGTSSTALALRSETQDLLAEVPVVLDCGAVGGGETDCLLGAGSVSRVRLTASRLEVRGLVRDGLVAPRFDGERPFEARILLSSTADDASMPGVLETAVELPLDDDHPSQITMSLSLVASAGLFDGLEPASIAASTDETLSFDDDPTVRAAFAELSLGVDIQRRDP